MKNLFFIFILILITLSTIVIALCSDVKIDDSYTGSINGIKVRNDSLDITDDPAYLIIGEEYKIKSKIKNIGDFDESNLKYLLSIQSPTGTIIKTFPHSTSSLTVGDSKYMPSGWDYWDTTGLTTGAYKLIANISITPIECNYSNNERNRIIILDNDDDNDGIVNTLDKCPNSRAGEPVDQDGCDPFQFCEPFYCSMNCFSADWKNNEGTNPNDCIVVIILRAGTYEPRCVPLTCID